jgi:hypothetical protein
MLANTKDTSDNIPDILPELLSSGDILLCKIVPNKMKGRPSSYEWPSYVEYEVDRVERDIIYVKAKDSRNKSFEIHYDRIKNIYHYYGWWSYNHKEDTTHTLYYWTIKILARFGSNKLDAEKVPVHNQDSGFFFSSEGSRSRQLFLDTEKQIIDTDDLIADSIFELRTIEWNLALASVWTIIWWDSDNSNSPTEEDVTFYVVRQARPFILLERLTRDWYPARKYYKINPNKNEFGYTLKWNTPGFDDANFHILYISPIWSKMDKTQLSYVSLRYLERVHKIFSK